MKSYGQFCPVAKAAELFCERWTPLILRDLAGGATRFSELQRSIQLASPTILSRRLKELEAEGIVERRRSASGRSWTYHLTPAGTEFGPIIEALGVWGQHWTRRELADNELDLGLFIWGDGKRGHARRVRTKQNGSTADSARPAGEQTAMVVREPRWRL